jgi:hypothetical protein
MLRLLMGLSILSPAIVLAVDRQQKLYGQPDFDPVKTFEEKFAK